MYPGQIIHGQRETYELLEPLASGTFGLVWRAYAQGSEKVVAIKFFKPGFGSKTSFDNEIHAYQVLSEYPSCDPFIVCMYDYNPDGAPGLYFIVQELMAGDLVRFTTNTDKHARIKFSNSYSVAVFMIQCLEGLRHIHESGMAHSDIKPGNLLYSVSKEFIDPVSKEILYPNKFFNDWTNIRDHTCFKFGDPGAVCTTSEQKGGKRHFLRKNLLRYAEAKSCGIEMEGKYTQGLKYIALCEFNGTANYIAPEFYKDHVPNIEFYQKNDVWGLGQTFRAVLHGVDKIVLVHGEHFGVGYSKIASQLDIVPRTFEGTHSHVDNAINHVINDGMLRYDYKERADASKMLLVLNNALSFSLFEEEKEERFALLPELPDEGRAPRSIVTDESILSRISSSRTVRKRFRRSEERISPQESRELRKRTKLLPHPESILTRQERRETIFPTARRLPPPPEVRFRAPRAPRRRQDILKRALTKQERRETIFPTARRLPPPPEVRFRAPRRRQEIFEDVLTRQEGEIVKPTARKNITINLPDGERMHFYYDHTTIGALKTEIFLQSDLPAVEFLHLLYRSRELSDWETLDHLVSGSQLDLIMK